MHKAFAWSPNSPRHGSGRHLLWRLARVGHGHADLSDRRTRSRTASCGHHFGLKKSDMAAIDYATCGVNDVIAHSLKLHPRLLADRVRSHARVHAEFADAYGDPEVTRNELGLADRLALLRRCDRPRRLHDTRRPRCAPRGVQLCGAAARSAPDHAEGDRRARRCAECASGQKRLRLLRCACRLRGRQASRGVSLGQSGPVPAPRPRAASGAPCRAGASHARSCKSASEVVRAGCGNTCSPSRFSMSGPMLAGNMPNKSVLATTVGISRSSLTRTVSCIPSL